MPGPEHHTSVRSVPLLDGCTYPKLSMILYRFFVPLPLKLLSHVDLRAIDTLGVGR